MDRGVATRHISSLSTLPVTRWLRVVLGLILLSIGSSAFSASIEHTGELVLENAVTPDGVELGKLTLRYKLTAFMGEGVRRFILAWEPPHELISLGSVTLHAQVVQGGTPLDAWLSCSPMIPKPHKGFSWDFPGSPDWDEFFFTEAGDYLTPEKAKAIYKKDFTLANLRVAKALAHVNKAGHPLQGFVGRTRIRKSEGAPSDLETALDAATPDNDFTTGTLSGWQFDKVTRWTQGGRGKIETWQAEHLGRNFRAVRLTMEFLPTGHPLDEKPHDYANVSLNVDYPSLDKKKNYSFKLRENETWVTLWESPPPTEGIITLHLTPFITAHAERAMTGKPKDEATPDEATDDDQTANTLESEKPTLDPFADPDAQTAASSDKTKPGTNPFASSATDSADTGATQSTDPFKRASDTLAEKQRQAEAARAEKQRQAEATREADEFARGVSTRLYLVVETFRYIDSHNLPMPHIRGLVLTTDKFRDHMRNDPAFRARVEARRKREAEERAAKNRRIQAQVDDELNHLQSQLDSRPDRHVFSPPLELAISERPRSPLELTDEEEKKLKAWLKQIRPKILASISLTGEYHRAEVRIKHHLFPTRAEAEAFIQDKPTRDLPSSFQF